MLSVDYTVIFSILEICRARIDLGFLIDSSSLIGSRNFRRSLAFIKAIVRSFVIARRYTRVGCVLFSSRPYGIFNFNKFSNKQQVIRAIDGMRYTAGRARAGSALRFTTGYLFGRRASRLRKRVLVVLAGGRSPDDVRRPAYFLKVRGVSVLAVGAGRRYYRPQLQQIATDSKHVFVTGFKNLVFLARKLKQRICKKAPGKKPGMH